MKFIFRLILLIFATALVFGYLSLFINPTKIWILSFFGLYFIPIVIINLVLLIIAVLCRSKSAWITVVAILPSFLFFDNFIGLNKNDDNRKLPSNSLKILTYNVGRFIYDTEHPSQDQCMHHIIDYISTQQPSIIALQEFSIADTSEIEELLPEYPYRQHHLIKIKNEYFGNITFSKYPIIGGGKISFKKSTNLSIFSDIRINGSMVRIYNNHLQSYNISLGSLINKLKRSFSDTSDEIINLHEKMIISNSKRAEQVNIVLEHIEKSPFISIVCGDFNDTPMSYTYHMLSKGRKDTFKEAGEGFSGTYSFLWPLLRIDYILVPEAYTVYEHITFKEKYSDHYPVISSISI